MNKMTSMERVMASLSFKEPDKVPLFLLFSFYGAKEIGVSIEEYFDHPDWVAETQLKLQSKFDSDCLYSFYHAALETEAWGSDVIFFPEGPPNSGRPVIHRPDDIAELKVPDVQKSPGLMKVIKTTELLKKGSKGNTPIIGVVMSPFSLPVMQMGLGPYLDLIYSREDMMSQLMDINSRFCVNWANAQVQAGASAICYFDPMASTDMVPIETYRKWGYTTAKKTIAQIKGPTATHLASARAAKALELIKQTGTAGVAFSYQDDLKDLKKRSHGALSLLGGINGISLRKNTPEEIDARVKELITDCAPGGGYILSDNHGEIPWQTPEEALYAIVESRDRWGKYPI